VEDPAALEDEGVIKKAKVLISHNYACTVGDLLIITHYVCISLVHVCMFVCQSIEDTASLACTYVLSIQRVSSKEPKVEFMVLLCSSCAKMLTGEEPMAEMSAIVVAQGATFPDFESASQVGSQASFPQWDIETDKGIILCLTSIVCINTNY